MPAAPATTPRRKGGIATYAWVIVGLLWVVAVLNYLDRLMITSMRTAIIGDIPMTDAKFALLTSAFLWIYGLVSPVGGYLADRYSRKWVIMVSLAVWSTMMLVTGRMHTFETLLAARAIMGVSEACYLSAALALISDYHAGTTRSLATALHQSGLYVGAALGGMGGWIAAHSGWRATFELFGVAGVAYAVVLVFLLRDRKTTELEGGESLPPQATIHGTVHALFTALPFWLLCAYIGAAGASFWLVNGWLPTLIQENFANWHAGSPYAVTTATAGLWATVPVQTASFLGVVAGGIWADRWSQINVRGRINIVTLGFACAAPCLFLVATTPVFGLALIGMVVFGIGRGFSDANLMPIVCQVLNPAYRATAYGFLNLASVTVGGIMIYAGGFLRDRHIGLSVTFAIASFGLLAACACMFSVGRATRSNQFAP